MHPRALSSHVISSPLDAALRLDEIERDEYVQAVETLWTPAGSRAVYGGQIVGAAMLAAERSRTSPFPLHSLHSYFLRPGVSIGPGATPIHYAVTRLRDGGSFETRAVTARQNGEAIFTAMLSFHKLEADESGGTVGHAVRAPTVPPPEECTALRVGATKFPIEVRPCAPFSKLLEPTWPAQSAAWFKLPPLPPPSPSTAHLHRAALAFASDWGLGTASLLPYGIRWGDSRLAMAASLDHALFYHDSFDGGAAVASPPRGSSSPVLPITRHVDAPRVPAAPAPIVRADEWLLVEFESTALRSSRGLNFSKMWTRDGTLIVSAVQESLLRVVGKPADR